MDVGAYLERIRYRGALDPSLETLRGLHRAHLYTVPFENLDILLGRPILLGAADLFDKVVTRRRGGFCYELNGIFSTLLRELGFRVTLLSSEVARATEGFSPEFDHLALRVDLDESWLADVGFGDGFRAPLRLQDPAEQDQDGTLYRISRDSDYHILMRRDPSAWSPQYRFTDRPRTLDDFAERCCFHQTSPESHFTRGRICTLATSDGRITLSELRLIVTSNGQRTERLLADEAEYAAVLQQTFGVIE